MQQRTRHASLDFPRTNRQYPSDDEWGEFLSLSTSMLALAEDSNLASDVPPPPRSMGNVDFASQTLATMSMHDTFRTDGDLRKMGIPPPPATAPAPTRSWRPLGRRASAHVLSTSNQFEMGMLNSEKSRARTLKHATSFAGIIKPQVSSPSSSSLVESSSSDEEQSDHDDGNQDASATVDADAATARYPVLTSLPPNSRNVNANMQAPPLVHAKSPVLSNRKDEQTWQLKEEELLASPRYSFRSSMEEDVTAMFDAGMSLLE